MTPQAALEQGLDALALKLPAEACAKLLDYLALMRKWNRTYNLTAIRDPLGMVLGQRITPLDRVGVYVPGGKACYPSTVLMNTIPAKVAGVNEIVMTSPLGSGSAIILAAAHIAGVERIFRVGGAQAIHGYRRLHRLQLLGRRVPIVEGRGDDPR